MKFNLTCCHVEFDVTKKNNNNLVGSYLKYAYNHDFLEETSRLYHIRSLTRLKLRIYFKHALFYRLSHSWQAIKCKNRIWPDLAFGFVNKGLASTLTSMKLGTNPSDSQSSYASAIHLNSLALISFLSDHVPLLSIVLFLGLMLEKCRCRIYREEKSDVKEIQICENMELVGIFRKKKMRKSALAKNKPVSANLWGDISTV